MNLVRTLLAAAALAALATPASAVTYVFTVSGSPEGSWELPASPAPDIVFSDAFRIDSVTGTLGGAPFTTFMEFYVSSSGGGVCAGLSCALVDLYGPQLFSGALAAPTFELGVYSMNDAFGRPVARLTISEAGDDDVPQPGSWAMMISGLGLAGAGLRRRREAAITA